MKRPKSNANRDRTADFKCDPGFINIRNSNGKSHALIGWTVAALLILAPLIRHLIPGTTWFAFDEPGWFGVFIYAFAIFACISTGFWWSTIHVDINKGSLQYKGRWGLFTNRVSLPVRTFTEVRIESDSDGCTVVALIGLERLEIVRWRTRKESVRIARLVARRLCLPLTGEEDDDRNGYD